MERQKKSFNSNQLKMIAILAMTLDHLLSVAHGASGGVQILHTQNHFPALLPGAEPDQQAAEDIS